MLFRGDREPFFSMTSYPHAIDNGAGERLTFTGRVLENGIEKVVGDARVQPGAGPPMHLHHQQEEGFSVVRGRIGVRRPGQEPMFAGPGETVVFAAGEAHAFWNAGDDELYCSAWIAPPGNAEFFLGALFASQVANGGSRPHMLDVAYLTRRYRSEYSMSVIPMPVQQIVFPVLVAIGHMIGRYAKYANAPEPLPPVG